MEVGKYIEGALQIQACEQRTTKSRAKCLTLEFKGENGEVKLGVIVGGTCLWESKHLTSAQPSRRAGWHVQELLGVNTFKDEYQAGLHMSCIIIRNERIGGGWGRPIMFWSMLVPVRWTETQLETKMKSPVHEFRRNSEVMDKVRETTGIRDGSVSGCTSVIIKLWFIL